jgi:hypothetical protein
LRPDLVLAVEEGVDHHLGVVIDWEIDDHGHESAGLDGDVVRGLMARA